VRELPRQLSVEELEVLFEGHTRFVELLAGRERPLEAARALLEELPEDERLAVLDAHPPIGARAGLSAAAAGEQGTQDDPAVLAELAELNRRYEQRFGFRFVVFVNRRPRSAIVPVLRGRLERTREQELATALDELVAIAQDRWVRG
jgi:2-oxo-4-hydroxy-4-carboxy--5-ureidoimidazoline (OHCU) decarboxylase